jgi:DNA transformation protein
MGVWTAAAGKAYCQATQRTVHSDMPAHSTRNTIRNPGKPVPALVSHSMELLGVAGSVRCCRMFGGWGFYVDGIFVALLAYDRLYLKANENTRSRFEAAGCEPFIYEAKGQPMQLSYYTAPAEAMDAPNLMQPWVALALQAAVAARGGKPARGPKTPAQTPSKTPAQAATQARRRNNKA